MPMPESRTAKVIQSALSSVVRVTRSSMSACSVNLLALLSKQLNDS
jgi:hypothetical protein